MSAPAALPPMNEPQQEKYFLLRQELKTDTNCESPYRSRFDDNIKIDVTKIVFDAMQLIKLPEERSVQSRVFVVT